jgi:L-ascorbate peroxidase
MGSAQRRNCVKVKAAVNLEQLRGAKKELEGIIRSTSCNPIFVRLGWHDAGTFDKVTRINMLLEKQACAAASPDRRFLMQTALPARGGGARGTIRFNPEIAHGANAGKHGVITLCLLPRSEFPRRCKPRHALPCNLHATMLSFRVLGPEKFLRLFIF